VNLVRNNSYASSLLDMIRFLAAFMVLLYHAGVFFIPGYQAVMVFFVLSGYFISSSVLKLIRENKWSWSFYLINRITRLWIVLLPALLMTLFWAGMNFKFYGVTGIADDLNWKVFIGNCVFLQDISFPVYGSNGPLWSLTYEFWYYILFPCIALIFYSSSFIKRILYLLIVICLSIFLGPKIMGYFLIWLMGTFVLLLKPIIIRSSVIRKLIVCCSLVIAVLSTSLLYKLLHINHPTWTTNQFFPDLLVGIAFCFLFYLFLSFYNDSHSSSENKKLFKTAKLLAGFSYTLYLTHYPLVQFLQTWYSNNIWVHSLNSLLKIIIKLLLLGIFFIYAWLISRLTENNTDIVRRFLIHRLFKGACFDKLTKDNIDKAAI
jgi:peptidoglycan/LPS O-acetylase OafA/YrhL